MLGDENNNHQVDLGSVKLESCALLVIDELGDPTGGPLETVLVEPTLNSSRTTPTSPVSIRSLLYGASTASRARLTRRRLLSSIRRRGIS